MSNASNPIVIDDSETSSTESNVVVDNDRALTSASNPIVLDDSSIESAPGEEVEGEMDRQVENEQSAFDTSKNKNKNNDNDNKESAKDGVVGDIGNGRDDEDDDDDGDSSDNDDDDDEDESEASSHGTSIDESYSQSDSSQEQDAVPRRKRAARKTARKTASLHFRPPPAEIFELLSSSSEQEHQEQDSEIEAVENDTREKKPESQDSEDERMKDVEDSKMPERVPSPLKPEGRAPDGQQYNEQHGASFRQRPTRNSRALSRLKCPICLKLFPGDVIEEHASTCGLKRRRQQDDSKSRRKVESNKKIAAKELDTSSMSSTSAATGNVNDVGRGNLSGIAKSGNLSADDSIHEDDDNISNCHPVLAKPPGVQSSRISSPTKRKRSDTDNRLCKFSRKSAGTRQLGFSDHPAVWKEQVKDALRKVQQERKVMKLFFMKATLQRNRNVLLNQRKLVKQQDVKKSKDFLKNPPRPNTIPRQVFVKEIRPDESSSSSETSRSKLHSDTGSAVDMKKISPPNKSLLNPRTSVNCVGKRTRIVVNTSSHDVNQHQELDSMSDLAGDFPLPIDRTSTIFLKRLFSLQPGADDDDDDDESSSNSKEGINEESNKSDDVPCSSLMGADNCNELVSSCIDDETSEFHDIERVGAGYEVMETDDTIEAVFERLSDTDHDPKEVRSYLHYLLRTTDRSDKKATKNEAEPEMKTPYERAMSSFREMYCRRCCIYDCHLHGLADNFDPDLQADLACQKELDGNWMDTFYCLPTGGNGGNQPVCPPPTPKAQTTAPLNPQSRQSDSTNNPTEQQMVLCKKLCHIFQGDVTKIARASRLPAEMILTHFRSEIDKHVNTKRAAQLTSTNDKQRRNQRSNPTPAWARGHTEAKEHNFYFPCFHTEPCTKETCTCIQNRYFCTKHCIWGATSRNFFNGCKCVGRCNTQSCPCLASNRECDPDLCKTCGACSDPPNQPATQQNCRNDNIGMRRHAHLLVAKSSVNNGGWGLFNKYPLKKGDYIHEYLGEVIKPHEGDKRGLVYDKLNSNYLFTLTKDYLVDAWNKGNKTRFMNHSNTPNVLQKLHMVNGDFRIGFFAKENIPAQSELFFDYGTDFYSTKGNFIDNDRSKKEDEVKKKGASKKGKCKKGGKRKR